MTKSWKEALLVYSKKESLALLCLGFSSGLPLWLYFGTLSVWLSEAKVQKSTIGFFSFVGLCYAFKWVWSPLVDRMPLPVLSQFLGRRRSWMLLSQLGVMAGLVGMALTDPVVNLKQMAVFSVVLAFASATQDIVIDAFRIELVKTDMQASLAATYMTGYRVAQILASAGCLWIAQFFDPHPEAGSYDYLPWKIAYMIMAASMLFGVATTLLTSEPAPRVEVAPVRTVVSQNPIFNLGQWLINAVVYPFVDFVKRYKWHAVLILALISTYRISDIVLGVMANPFYIDMQFTKGEIANVSKVYGVILTLVGALSAGTFVARFGVMRVMFVGAFLSALTNVLFSVMAGVGHSMPFLTLVISLDNFSGGLASAAFIAYMSGLTNISYSATQYALFSSVMLLVPKLLGGFSGVIVEKIGYSNFFIFTAVIGLPVLVLILLANRYIPSQRMTKTGT